MDSHALGSVSVGCKFLFFVVKDASVETFEKTIITCISFANVR